MTRFLLRRVVRGKLENTTDKLINEDGRKDIMGKQHAIVLGH